MRPCLEALAAVLVLAPAPAAAYPGEVLGTIALPAPNVTGITTDGKTLWAADRKEDVIHALDVATGEIRGQFPSPGFRPVGMAWDGEMLWVADLSLLRIFRVDPASAEVVREIPVPGSYPGGLAHDGEHLWIADRGEKKIFEISTSDGTIVHDFPLPAGEITGMAWHDGWLWAAGRLDDEIYQIDPAEGLVVNLLRSPGPHPWGLAVIEDQLLVADYQLGEIARVSLVEAPDPWVRSETREYDLSYVIDVYNYGKDPLTTLDVWAGLPDGRPNQEILEGPIHSRAPDETVTTSTGQRYVRWSWKNLIAPGKAQVVTSHKVRLHQADWYVDPRRISSQFPKDVRKIYLADAEKYLTGDPYIQKVVKAVVGTEGNPYWKARRLFEWEIEKLEYKLAGGHENAPQVLERGNGSCSEYTFSFIALCRAAGVPARYVGSVVVRKDDASTDDVFHRWAEVYLPPYGWIPVDVNHGDRPTGRERALGFGHLTNNVLVTTVEGPLEENKLGWSYNSSSSWTFKGTAKVYEEPIAEWRPLSPVKP